MADLFPDTAIETIPCISLWQPWATAMALNLKKNETRHWSTKYRGPLAIHAAKKWGRNEAAEWDACVRNEKGWPSVPPLGAILCIVNLLDVRRVEDLANLSVQEEDWGNYDAGRFAWITDSLKVLPQPVPFVGRQGIFSVPASVIGMPA